MSLLRRNKDAPTAAAAPGGGQALVRSDKALVLSQADKEQERRQEMHLQQITQAWRVLRGEIDLAVDNYYHTGSLDDLKALLSEPLFAAAQAHLSGLRHEHVVWTQPKRRSTTHPHFDIIEPQLPGKDRDEHFRFILREGFRDFSLLQQWEDGRPVDEARATGEVRAVEATVAVLKGNKFRLVALYRRDPRRFEEQ